MIGTKNFTQFDLRTVLLTGDYLVGYKDDASTEIKTPVQSIVDLIGETDSQELTFDEITKDLTISGGNTVSLSSVLDYAEVTNVVDTTTTFQLSGARKIKLQAGITSTGETQTIILPRVTTDTAFNGDECYIIITSLGTGSNVQLNRYIWSGSEYIPFTESVYTFTKINQTLRLKLINYVWTIENVSTHGNTHGLNGSDPITLSFDQIVGGTVNGSISAENISLYNTTITEGTTLTESVSSLVLTLNGQQFRVPLLSI